MLHSYPMHQFNKLFLHLCSKNRTDRRGDKVITEIPDSSGSECSDDDSDYHPERPSGKKEVRKLFMFRERNLLTYFAVSFQTSLLDLSVCQSNVYALYKGKNNFGLTISELKIFLGINLMMSYVKYPRLRMYWSSNPGLRQNGIANAMTVNRFEDIMRHLHFVGLNDDAGDDRFFKIRPVLDVLQTTYLAAMEPEEFHTKQYIPKKPKPWGFKVWVRAGASTGYMYQFELYQGATGGRGQVGAFGMAAEVVLRLCEKIEGKNHKVFLDIFFCSIPILEKLKSLGIEATGTCRANRLMGSQGKLKDKVTLAEEGRGASSVVTSEENITVTWCLDSQVIHVASTYAGKNPQDVDKRWAKKEKKVIQILRPHVIKLYNSSMGGVDLLGQCVATYANRRKNLRWYMHIFYHFLDDLLEFKASVAAALVSVGSHKRSPSRPSDVSPPPVSKRVAVNIPQEICYIPGHHWPLLMDMKNASRCRDEICKKKTKYVCQACTVALCPGCFGHFHTH
uniref:PiggyBac transposable element-derived protein domain-containing protein n=1 Tax=Astyanax mexicanus TaxID=7994 RepID=A0A3B1K204_ASTMX